MIHHLGDYWVLPEILDVMGHFRAEEKGGIGLSELIVEQPLEIVLQTTASEL